jgi:predicted adenine nucleotide alpha hydrolase (AANH) superfamily ATPase
MGYFHRRNIQPFQECQRREGALLQWAQTLGLRIVTEKGYGIEDWLRGVVFREKDRCAFCYHDRLRAAARIARAGKFDAFTSTLLYSKYQKHNLAAEIGASVGEAYNVPFYYEDFRIGWDEGVEESMRLDIYRQQYCGCVYSEKERFAGARTLWF